MQNWLSLPCLTIWWSSDVVDRWLLLWIDACCCFVETALETHLWRSGGGFAPDPVKVLIDASIPRVCVKNWLGVCFRAVAINKLILTTSEDLTKIEFTVYLQLILQASEITKSTID